MEILPKELLVDTLSYFSERELLGTIALVCKRWREFVLRSDLWARVGCKKVHALCSRIIWAAEHNHLEVLDGLVKYYNFHYFKKFKKNIGINLVDDDRNTILWRASANGYLKTVKALLERGASTSSELGLTSPLWIAASNGHADVCQELLRYKADVNFQTREGVTPLWRAVYQSSIECVQVLLKANSDPNLVASWGSVRGSCLRIAASNGNILIMQLLMHHGAAISKENSDGELTVACLHGHVEVVKLLLEHGATFGRTGKAIFERMAKNSSVGHERAKFAQNKPFYVDSMLFNAETLKNYTKIARIMLDYLNEGDIADCEYQDVLLGKCEDESITDPFFG